MSYHFQWGEGPAVIIKRVRKNVFDFFFGAGWDGWSRAEVSNGELKVIAGRQQDQRTVNFMKARVVK